MKKLKNIEIDAIKTRNRIEEISVQRRKEEFEILEKK